MIVTYIPATEDVVAELMPYLWEEPDLAKKVKDIITELKSLGYEVSRQVTVTGAMEKALQDAENRQIRALSGRKRPIRDSWADDDIPRMTIEELDAADERDGIG